MFHLDRSQLLDEMIKSWRLPHNNRQPTLPSDHLGLLMLCQLEFWRYRLTKVLSSSRGLVRDCFTAPAKLLDTLPELVLVH